MAQDETDEADYENPPLRAWTKRFWWLSERVVRPIYNTCDIPHNNTVSPAYVNLNV
jgi:hypothetical protein